MKITTMTANILRLKEKHVTQFPPGVSLRLKYVLQPYEGVHKLPEWLGVEQHWVVGLRLVPLASQPQSQDE